MNTIIRTIATSLPLPWTGGLADLHEALALDERGYTRSEMGGIIGKPSKFDELSEYLWTDHGILAYRYRPGGTRYGKGRPWTMHFEARAGKAGPPAKTTVWDRL